MGAIVRRIARNQFFGFQKVEPTIPTFLFTDIFIYVLCKEKYKYENHQRS